MYVEWGIRIGQKVGRKRRISLQRGILEKDKVRQNQVATGDTEKFRGSISINQVPSLSDHTVLLATQKEKIGIGRTQIFAASVRT